MKRKLSRSKAAPVQLRGRAATAPPLASAAVPSPQYKVVELSIVDEISLERALNQWTCGGWRLDSIHFAMRDSSKRPAMAFLLFTRPNRLPAGAPPPAEPLGSRADLEHVSADPWRRLRELAGVQAGDDEPVDPTSE